MYKCSLILLIMKQILIGLFILSSTTLFAQDNRDNRDKNQNANRSQNTDGRNTQVPDNVQHSFQQDYHSKCTME